MMLSPEKEEQVKSYIQKARDLGFSLSAIEQKLRQAGYRIEHIRQLTSAFARPEGDRLAPAKRKFWLIVGSILLLTGISIAVWYFSPGACADEQCLRVAAAECGTAAFRTTLEGSTVEHRVNNCKYTRTMITIGPDEPPEVQQLFGGKSLTCDYAKGNFNEEWLSTVSIGLEGCTGELKEAIDAVVNAQRELGVIELSNS